MRAGRWVPFVVLLELGAACAAREAARRPRAVPPGESPQQVLDRLDTRIPLPLLAGMANMQKKEMRDHLLAVQEIVLGLAAGDFDAVERAAGRIGTSAFDEEACQRMGMNVEGFAEQSSRFHRTADGIARAARQKDRDAVLSTLGDTLQTCTGCHAAYKQVVVGDETFSR